MRPPADDEKWRGGWAGSGGRGRGGGSRAPEVIRQVTLVLDGIFFRDGEFVGPDTARMFEHTAAEAEAHRIVSRIARQAHGKGLSAADILAEIEKTTGPAPEGPPMPPHLHNPAATKEDFLKAALGSIAFQLSSWRRFPQAPSDDQAVFNIMSWDQVDLPRFRRG